MLWVDPGSADMRGCDGLGWPRDRERRWMIGAAFRSGTFRSGSRRVGSPALLNLAAGGGVVTWVRVVVFAVAACVSLARWLANAPVAAAGWSIQPIPNPVSVKNGSLTAVSCASRTACAAVGTYNDPTGHQLPLVERWNDTSWAIEQTRSPSGATASQLRGCRARRRPPAFPSGATTSHPATEGHSWSGGTARAGRSSGPPSPAGATDSGLYGVSCASLTACSRCRPDRRRAHTEPPEAPCGRPSRRPRAECRDSPGSRSTFSSSRRSATTYPARRDRS